jgi:hypothetical protein
MNKSHGDLQRLLKAAAAAPREWPPEAPFGLETRILACWGSSGGEPDSLLLLPLLQRGFVCACVMILLSVAMYYPSLMENGSNLWSIADSAIKLSLLP